MNPRDGEQPRPEWRNKGQQRDQSQDQSRAETTLDSSINGTAREREPEAGAGQPAYLMRPPAMKPSRSLSIIIGDHGKSTAKQNCCVISCQPPTDAQEPARDAAGRPILACGRASRKLGQQLHSQYSMPCSLNSRRQMQHSSSVYQIQHSLTDERIVYCQLSIVSKKDFAEEVRALLDVRKFVTNSFILTDVSEVQISSIVGTIIDRLVECRQLGGQVAAEAKTQLLLERHSLSMMLANTMQGLYKSRPDGRIAYDHSWLVANCSLNSLQKRQVAIARFAQPVNFGRQSGEVRFLIIVLAPSKEKLTKSAWETARTFATMFTDIEFRRRMLRAKNHEEMKMELLVRAEMLACDASKRGAAAAADLHEQPCDEFQLELERQHDELNRELAHMAAKPKVEPMSSLELFDSKMMQHREAELRRRKEQLEAMREAALAAAQSGLARAGKRASEGNSLGSASKLKPRPEPVGAACCPRLPGSLGALGAGLLDDLARRSAFYLSDYTDGFLGERSLYKTISTTIFLYFSVLLPCIAFGLVDTNNTDGAIDPKKTMIGQALGGLAFALLGGQPLVVVMTTAPLCIYVKVIYQISQDLEVEFGSFYAAVGVCMALFLFLMSISNLSNLMEHCTRSTEDIFALFTAFAFGSDGVKEAIRCFHKYYWEPDCLLQAAAAAAAAATATSGSAAHILEARALHEPAQAPAQASLLLHAHNGSGAPGGVGGARHGQQPVAPQASSLLHAISTGLLSDQHTSTGANSAVLEYGHQPAGFDATAGQLAEPLAVGSAGCQRETCIMFLFLMCGTLWLANSFNSFDRTPYLSSRKREIIKDYALAISVLIFSFIGSYLFADIRMALFEFRDYTGFQLASLPAAGNWLVWLTAALLGFMASVLFYIDQNICGAMVNNAPYKLPKGNYFHLDLLVLALLNSFLSLAGFPWMHGKLPHSHLHSKALADYEERVDEGHIHQIIVNIRETRLTGILVSLLIGLSLLAVPYPLSYIPIPVLSGVFLYTALAEFKSNSMVERVCLLFTEQTAYPPNHYIRRCPQRKIHLFTLAQILQLAVVSFIGFYPNPYVNMTFPLAVVTFVPIRELFLPKLIDPKYLNSLDSASLD